MRPLKRDLPPRRHTCAECGSLYPQDWGFTYQKAWKCFPSCDYNAAKKRRDLAYPISTHKPKRGYFTLKANPFDKGDPSG